MRELAENLRDAWSAGVVVEAIAAAHIHGAQSEAISLILSSELKAAVTLRGGDQRDVDSVAVFGYGT